jgi:hypothetical protein
MVDVAINVAISVVPSMPAMRIDWGAGRISRRMNAKRAIDAADDAADNAADNAADRASGLCADIRAV